jgi:hypothetical protein
MSLYAQAVAAERAAKIERVKEQCAAVCDAGPKPMQFEDDADYDTGLLHGFRLCAAAIRKLEVKL